MKNINKLKERASKAFDAGFRDRLADAVTGFVLNGGKIKTSINAIGSYDDCRCPDGCLTINTHPMSIDMANLFGFTVKQHGDFQVAFDCGRDSETPESALGLLYRNKFIKQR